MSQFAIVTDLNRCVGCLACSVACKVANGVEIGSFWNKVTRRGPFNEDDADWSEAKTYMYFLPVQCQHCANPECVAVCPTGASVKAEDGTVQIDQESCIGCQACVSACPYGVRYLNADKLVVEKCTMCHDLTEQGYLPACVAQCSAQARYYGDLDEGIDTFKGQAFADMTKDVSYEGCMAARQNLVDSVKPYTEDDLYRLDDHGNGPSNIYILRGHPWVGLDKSFAEL